MDATERARLVERHLDLAQRAAKVIYPRVKAHVEFQELVALGNAGLAEAAQRYEPDRGASFNTFAWYRVHGAIIDGLRKQSNLPRREWAKLVALRAASEYLEQRGEREVGAAQRGVAAPSGADALAAMKSAMAAIKTMYVTSLEAMREGGFDPAADSATSVDEKIDTTRLAHRLSKAFETLPERERALMRLHYWEGKNLLEAGAALGISKSWASRMHSQAVDRLRGMLDENTARGP
ncbi:MAG: sigma-70 family RNA polymerase sigma factor [Deltaproteobacteria bacterium]|nr:sigma-70 family RNA polymerase sigma factor [Deltaproteobacteria bacterium]